ncbi:unnamed protein product [Lepidochelys kempii]
MVHLSEEVGAMGLGGQDELGSPPRAELCTGSGSQSPPRAPDSTPPAQSPPPPLLRTAPLRLIPPPVLRAAPPRLSPPPVLRAAPLRLSPPPHPHGLRFLHIFVTK